MTMQRYYKANPLATFFELRNRSSTTDAHRLTRIIKAFEDWLRFIQWGNDLQPIFIRVHRCPFVVY